MNKEIDVSCLRGKITMPCFDDMLRDICVACNMTPHQILTKLDAAFYKDLASAAGVSERQMRRICSEE